MSIKKFFRLVMQYSARESRIKKRTFVTKTAIKIGYYNRHCYTTTFLYDLKFMLKIKIQVKFVSDLYLFCTISLKIKGASEIF